MPRIDQSAFYKEYLASIDDSVWREPIGSGAARRRKSDLFLDYWLESALHRPVNARYVFREFRNAADKIGDENLVRWCSEINLGGKYFSRWEGISVLNGDTHTLFHSQRNILRVGAIWPLLALSRTAIDSNDRNRCFRALDSFLWRRAIVSVSTYGMSTRNYDTLALSLLRALPENPEGDSPYSDALIDVLLDSQGQHRLRWPNDDEVREAILNTPLYPVSMTRVLLEAIERGMMRARCSSHRGC